MCGKNVTNNMASSIVSSAKGLAGLNQYCVDDRECEENLICDQVKNVCVVDPDLLYSSSDSDASDDKKDGDKKRIKNGCKAVRSLKHSKNSSNVF